MCSHKMEDEMRGWEKYVRKVEPYVPGEQPKGNRLIKLNTNENPYPPSPKVMAALQTMEADALRKYPDPASGGLKEALARYYGLETNQVFVGVGSDDVLGMAFLTFFNADKPILFPDVTYSFYPVWAGLFRIPYVCPPLDAGFGLHKEDYFRENGGIIFPNPNAPTGIALALEEIEEIVRRNKDVVVIVDEAYIDFGGQSALALAKRYENLLVVQTFSKSRSMAGVRIGYAMGSPALIEALENVRYSYNSYTMNLPSQILGVEAVRDQAYFAESVGKIVTTREETKGWLREMGFSFPDSQANFIFASHEKVDAAKLFNALKQEEIYVRYFKQPRLENFLRITIGTDEEMNQLREFLERYTLSDAVRPCPAGT